MPTHTCPICKKQFAYQSIESSPELPFCSRRCRLIDLGRWLDGSYVVEGSEEEDRADEERKPE